MRIDELRIGQFVYHEELYWGRERMKVVGLRETEVELEGDWSGGTHRAFGRDWMPLEGIRLTYNENPKYNFITSSK
jgi:hypothetical protein